MTQSVLFDNADLGLQSPSPMTVSLLPQEGALLAWEPQFWKRKILLQATGKLSGRLLMAVAIGARPSIFFSSTESKEVYVIHTVVSETKASKGERYASFDCKRGLLAIACHPTDASTFFQLHDDSTVTAIGLRAGQRAPELLWSVNLHHGSSIASQASPCLLPRGQNQRQDCSLKYALGRGQKRQLYGSL